MDARVADLDRLDAESRLERVEGNRPPFVLDGGATDFVAKRDIAKKTAQARGPPSVVSSSLADEVESQSARFGSTRLIDGERPFDVGKFGLDVGNLGLDVGKFGLVVGKLGLDVGKFGLDVGKFGLDVGKVRFVDDKFSLDVGNFEHTPVTGHPATARSETRPAAVA